MSEARILKHDPLSDTEAILREEYYGKTSENDEQAISNPTAAAPRRTKKPKPTHYKVVCISLYTKDIESLEEKVAELKKRGYTRANKSQLIRFALDQLDLDRLPPPHP